MSTGRRGQLGNADWDGGGGLDLLEHQIRERPLCQVREGSDGKKGGVGELERRKELLSGL